MKNNLMMRRLLSSGLALALIAVAANPFTAQTTYAQTNPVPVTETVTEELDAFAYDDAPYFSSDWRTLEAGASSSISFEYSGRNRPVMVWMEISTIAVPDLALDMEDSVGFEIWTPDLLEQQAAGEDVGPLGMGLPLQTTSSTEEDSRTSLPVTITGDDPDDEADDTDADDTDADDTEVMAEINRGSTELFWYANLPAPETFVIVLNGDASEDLQYMLNVSGTGLVMPDEMQSGADATTDTDTTDTVPTGQTTPGGVLVNVTPAEATDVNIATVLVPFLNVRGGPGLEFPIITTAPQGLQVLVIAQDSTTAWLAIQLDNDQLGWVSRELTDFTDEVQVIENPVVGAQPLQVDPPVDPTAVQLTTVIAAEVNVRQGPTLDYPIITSIDQGAIVTVTGQNEENTWIQVDLDDGRIGWIDRTLTDYAGVAAVVEAPPLAEVEATGVGGEEPIDPNVAFVTALALNMREGPSTLFGVIATLEQGAPITVLGSNATNNWLLVETQDGIQGWVSRTFTNYAEVAEVVEEPETTVPTPGGLVQPPANVATVTATTVNMRQGPSVRFPVITTLASNTVIGVVGSNLANTWLLVEIEDGTQGWINRSLTSFTATAPVFETPALPITPAESDVEDDAGAEEEDEEGNTEEDAVPLEGTANLPSDSDSAETAPAEEELAQNWFVLSEDTTQWFRFDHPGNDEPIHIWMEAEPSEGAGFRVFDENQAQAIIDGADPNSFSAIGRGTANPAEPGNLFWRGVFSEAGIFYVMVEHAFEGDVSYAVYGAGPGLE